MRTVCFRRRISAPCPFLFPFFFFPLVSFHATRATRHCASIRPAIKRYGDTSSLAIDFRAPSPSLLLRSLHARRNPLRQLSLSSSLPPSLPPVPSFSPARRDFSSRLVPSRRRRLTAIRISSVTRAALPPHENPPCPTRRGFRRVGAIFLEPRLVPTFEKVRLSCVGQPAAISRRRALPRSKRLLPSDGSFFFATFPWRNLQGSAESLGAMAQSGARDVITHPVDY